MSSDPEIIALLREIRDLLADERREQHDAQPAHRPAPHPIPEDGGRARQTPTDPWHSPDWDDAWANGWYVGARAAEERALRAEALVRAKDETIGELLELIPDGPGEGTWTRIDHLAAEDWRQYHEDIRLGRFS